MPDFLADALSWDNHAGVKLALNTAKSWGKRPTHLLVNEDSDVWTDLDNKLALALQILENETDSETGLPIWVAYSDSGVYFKVETHTNYAVRELEKTREKRKKELGKGEQERVVVDDAISQIPSREDFYKELDTNGNES